MPVWGMPLHRGAQGCSTGTTGSWGTNPYTAPSALTEAASGARGHTQKQQFLCLLFFSPLCGFFWFSLPGGGISSSSSSSLQPQLMPQAPCHHLLCCLEDFAFPLLKAWPRGKEINGLLIESFA